MTTSSVDAARPDTGRPPDEIAFYYPNPMWQSGAWIKNLLLFFDGVGVLLPRYAREHLLARDEEFVAPLQSRGLLHVLEPENVVDKAVTEQLATILSDLLTSGRLDGLQQSDDFHELSYSRLGYIGDPGLADMLFEELRARGLARPSTDGHSIPLHPMVRGLILVLLAQLLRAEVSKQGLALQPVTDRGELVGALYDLLALPNTPSAGHVVALDADVVGIDLSTHPVDEILDYRQTHRAEYRTYMRAVREFTWKLSQLPVELRAQVLADRREELADLHAELRRRAETAWKKPASLALALLGAVWTMASGDAIGAALAAGSTALGADPADTSKVGAYSYLFGRGLVRPRVFLKAH